MKEMYTIGEVSKITNIPIKALRNYDSLDLVKPHYINQESRYRYYTYDQFFYIDLIRYINKVLVVPLEDIKIMMNGSDDYHELLSFLEEHQRQIEDKIEQLDYSRKILIEAIENLKNKEKIDSRGFRIYEQYLLHRLVAVKDVDASIHNIDLHYSRNAKDFHFHNQIEGNTICYICYKKFFDPIKEELLISKVGTFTDKIIDGQEYMTLPEGRYLCCKFRYSDTQSYKAINSLVNYAKSHNIQLDDIAFQIVNKFELRALNKHDYEMEIQIPEIP